LKDTQRPWERETNEGDGEKNINDFFLITYGNGSNNYVGGAKKEWGADHHYDYYMVLLQ